jgi:hypothetical protein
MRNHILVGLGKYLDSSQKQVRLFGMIVAETISCFVDQDNKLVFELDASDELVIELRRLSKEEWNYEESIKNELPKYSTEPVQQATTHEREADSDDDSEIDLEPYYIPPHLVKKNTDDSDAKPKIPHPTFIRECLEYLHAPDSDADHVTKLRLALSTLPSLISKSSILELKDVGPDLLSLLLILSNQYEIPDFDKHKEDTILGILVRAPQTFYTQVIDLFYSNTIALYTRCQLLNYLAKTAWCIRFPDDMKKKGSSDMQLQLNGVVESRVMNVKTLGTTTKKSTKRNPQTTQTDNFSMLGRLFFNTLLRRFDLPS